MAARDPGETLLMKLTIPADECPELFRALCSVTQPRRRTRRLKELAVLGLMLERGALAGNPVAPKPSLAALGESVASQLDWDTKA
jgi:hypothetical protein